MLLREAINWSCSSPNTPAGRCILNWQWSTQLWIDSPPIAGCFIFSLLPVLRALFKWVSWVIFSVATIAASCWTNWCLRCCCVSPSGTLLEVPVIRPDSTPIAPGGTVSGAIACGCRILRKIITKRSGKCGRLYSEQQVKMEWVTANLHVQFKLNTAVYRCTAYSGRGFQWSQDFSRSVQCCLFIYKDTSWWITADNACLINIQWTFCDGKDV
jgi:hypothetical protein